MLAAAILAAGESRRMGVPKALAVVQGLTFVDHLLVALRHPRIGLIRVVLGSHAVEIRSRLKIDPGAIVLNPDWPKGQLTSVHAAIRSLPASLTEGLLLSPVDHPLISSRLVAGLIARFDSGKRSIILPTFRGKRGHPALFRASLYDELLAASPDVGARQVVWAHADDIEEVSTNEEGVILNLNDPESLKKATTSPSPP